MEENNIPYYILEKDTYTITKRLTPEGKTYCAVCSRLRRGSLYGFAQKSAQLKLLLDITVMTFWQLSFEPVSWWQSKSHATKTVVI